MNRNPVFYIFIMLLLVNAVYAAETPPALIMLLLIADDYEDPANNAIAAGVRADGRNMEQFGKLLDQNGIINVETPVILSGRQVSKTNILNTIKKIDVKSNDVFLVYFSGHGAVEGRKPRHHIYPCVGPVVYRDDLDTALRQKKSRLNILITDACSSSVEGYKFAASRSRQSTDAAIENLKILFNDYSGYLSLTAATEGEVAMGPDSGGFFTSSLVKNVLISNPPDNWDDVLKETKRQVNLLYDSMPASLKSENKEQFGQTNQNPKSYSMPVKAVSGNKPADTGDPLPVINPDPQESEEGWEEGDDWWGYEAFESEDWDDTDWETWDNEYSNWDDDAYNYEILENMSDVDWDALFEEFLATLSDTDYENLSEDELYQRFEEFMEDYMGGGDWK